MSAHPRTLVLIAASLATAAVVLTGCGSTSDARVSTRSSAVPTADVVSGVPTVDAIRDELPTAVQQAGILSVGTTLTPGTAFLPHGGQVDGQEVGLDVDLRNAVAKTLGVRWDEQHGTFASIIPSVQNGRYQVGQANFGATKAREEVVNFSTYLNDGQGFLGSSAVTANTISTLTDACGYTIATSPGSTFQQLLETGKDRCAQAGKKPWKVQYYSDNGPIFLGLANGKIDLYFGPTLSLKYAATQIEGTRFLGQLSSTPVGFVTAKNSGLAKPLTDAINHLIDSGDYHKIFAKWGVVDTGVARSEINPTPTF